MSNITVLFIYIGLISIVFSFIEGINRLIDIYKWNIVMKDKTIIDQYIKFYSSSNHKVIIDEKSNDPKIIIESGSGNYKSYSTFYKSSWFFSGKSTVSNMMGIIKYKKKARSLEAEEIETFKRLESESVE